jgi:hypothetical protein
MAITFHVLANQEKDIQLIENLKKDFQCACFGINAPDWASSVLSHNMVPPNGFTATGFAIDLFVDGNLWRVPHDTAIFLAKEDVDSYVASAIFLRKHGQLTFREMGLVPDGNFIRRVSAVDLSVRHKHYLIPLNSYLYESAKNSEHMKERVLGVLKWLLADINPL